MENYSDYSKKQKEIILPFFEYCISKKIRIPWSNSKRLAKYFCNSFGHFQFNGKKLLDIGGGNGLYTKCFALLGADKPICMEPESEGSNTKMLEEMEVISQYKPEKIFLNCKDSVQNYKIEEHGQFDIVVMNNSINHLEEDATIAMLEDPLSYERVKKALTNVVNLSKDHGIIIASDCGRKNISSIFGIKNPCAPTIEWHKHQEPHVWVEMFNEIASFKPTSKWNPNLRFGVLAELTRLAPIRFIVGSHFTLYLEKQQS